MKKHTLQKILLIGAMLLLATAFSGTAFGQLAKTADPVPYAGVMTAGDLWESYYPPCMGHYYGENPSNVAGGMFAFVRVGNWDRQWTAPTMMYPGWGDQHLPWGQNFRLTVYDPTGTINDLSWDGAANVPANRKYYMYTWYRDEMGGSWTADNAPSYTDPNRRDQMVYNASWPTNAGIDVKMKVRQWSMNHANMNDFILVDYVLTNTGNLDANGDGTAEKTNNKIEAFSMSFDHELINSMTNSTSGRRGASGWFTGPTSGFDATPDANGHPWAMPVGFSGPSTGVLTSTKTHNILVWDGATRSWNASTVTVPSPSSGNAYLGVTMNRRKTYQDIYHGYTWLGAHQGDIIAQGGQTGMTVKETLFGSHPVGLGDERGWYMNVTKDKFGGPEGRFIHATAQWYAHGDKAWDETQRDLSPDPNYFESGTAGNVLSFVPKANAADRGRPEGSMKYLNTYQQIYESDWKSGFNIRHQFDGNQVVGAGPFSLDVGETMSLSFVTYANFRLAGIRRTLKTARWVYANNYNVPLPPAAPDMKLEPSKAETLKGVKINVKWDDRAEADADFAGYKVYRVTATPNYDSFNEGVITMNHYHEQTTASPNSIPAAFKDPAGVTDGDGSPIDYTAYKEGTPGAYGPYHLIANIPAASLGSYQNTDSDASTYNYVFKDTDDLIYFGFTYWYYVAAYSSKSGTIDDVPFTTLESHKVNVNGSDGLWHDTYAFAYNSAYFPSTPAGLKAIGANFVLNPPQVTTGDVSTGRFPIMVRPNPYKKQALHDVGLQHKILFYNLAPNTKITILDISGQIIDVLDYEGVDAANGGMFWDMFSKDGIEVTSGLYIYVAELADGYKQTGYFSIMR